MPFVENASSWEECGFSIWRTGGWESQLSSPDMLCMLEEIFNSFQDNLKGTLEDKTGRTWKSHRRTG